jgi:hypothetical protein
MECINELTEMSKDESIRGPKRIDALLQKSALVTEAARLQAADEESEAQAENVTLKASLEEATAKIAELEGKLNTAERTASTRIVEKIADPETPILRNQVETLTAAMANLYSELDADTKARIVVKAALKDFDGARTLMKIFNIPPSDVHATLNSKQIDLHTALMNNPNGSWAPLNRAVLSLRDNFNGRTVQRSNEPYCADFVDEF